MKTHWQHQIHHYSVKICFHQWYNNLSNLKEVELVKLLLIVPRPVVLMMKKIKKQNQNLKFVQQINRDSRIAWFTMKNL